MDWNCLLCNNDLDGFTDLTWRVRDSDQHRIISCKACKHVQLFPVPSEAELKAYYRDERQRKSVHGHMSREEKRKHVQADTDRRASLAYSLSSSEGPMLDIGCGEGFFVESISGLGCKAYGIEIDGDKKGSQWPRMSFDVITMHHVLEHVPNVCELLEKCWEFTGLGGFLIIEVPNQDDWLISACAPYAAWHYQGAHLHYFTVRTLLSVVQRSKITYTSLQIKGVQRYGWLTAQDWQEYGKPDWNAPIGSPSCPGMDEPYREVRESTYTSDTLCLLLQK